MDDLPDVNIWVALSSPEHSHHERAKQYYEQQAGNRLCFCSATALGLVRVTSQKHTLSGRMFTCADAWHNLKWWLEQPDIVMIRDPDDFIGRIDHWVSAGLATGKNWTDIHIAAIAAGVGLRLVTFDHDFEKLDKLEMLVL